MLTGRISQDRILGARNAHLAAWSLSTCLDPLLQRRMISCWLMSSVPKLQACLPAPKVTAVLPSIRMCPVCRPHLHAAEEKAIEDQLNAKKRFRDWVKTQVPDAEYMNICSGPQVNLQCCHHLTHCSVICSQ